MTTVKSIIEDTFDRFGVVFNREAVAARRANREPRTQAVRTASFDLGADLRAQDAPKGNTFLAVVFTPSGVVSIGEQGAFYAQNYERITSGKVDTFRRKSSKAA